jgi:hypothetical protein
MFAHTPHRACTDSAIVIADARKSQKKRILLVSAQNMWTLTLLTLARESRHIVAFGPSDTTSRAAALFLFVGLVRRTRPVILAGVRRGIEDSALV